MKKILALTIATLSIVTSSSLFWSKIRFRYEKNGR